MHLFTLFSLERFDMPIEKAAVFFDTIFNLVFLLCFSVIRWNFGMFFGSFQRGSITVDRMDKNWPSLLIICNGWLNNLMSFRSVIPVLVIYWTKVKTLHLHCLPFICKIMQSSKANEVYLTVQRLDVVRRKHTKVRKMAKIMNRYNQAHTWPRIPIGKWHLHS